MNLLAQLTRMRHLEGRIRARSWPLLHPGISVGRDVRIGRGCRVFLDPQARLVLRDGCIVDDRTTLAAYGTGTVELGEGVFVGHHCTLAAHSSISIGDGTFLAELVSIRDHDHVVGQAPASTAVVVAPVSIGRDAWLGAKVTVLRGATIGSSAVVGANSVVRGALPAHTLSVGAPARVVRSIDEPREAE